MMTSKFSFKDVDNVASFIPDVVKNHKLSILIPVYNEEKLIAQNIRTISSLLHRWNWNFEIIASDDGSVDQTVEVLTKLALDIPELKVLSSSRNFGKGRALASAYEASSGQFILFLDSDLELPAEHIPYFFRKMLAENADIVIGSKKDKMSDLDYPLSRRLFSGVYFLCVKILFGLPVNDTQTGIKLFKRRVLEKALPYLLVKRFAFDIELLVLCHMQGASITSHPIVLHFVRDGIGRMTLNTILHMIKDTLAVFWRINSRFWRALPSGKTPLKIAVIAPKNVKANVGDVFVLEETLNIKELLPKIEAYDIVVFLHAGEEIESFMQASLERLFHNPSIDVAVPLLYCKYEQGLAAKRYYTLANAFYPIGAYPCFRPVRPQQIPKCFPLHSCAIRVAHLKKIIQEGANLATPLKNPHYSPFFFLYSDMSLTDWKRIHEQEACHGRYRAMARWLSLPTLMLFLLGVPAFIIFNLFEIGLLFMTPFILIELTLFGWYNFSLGIRRGLPMYLYFSAQRILRLFKASV
ncbi:MAG: glycosyltransferase family 2 protein [Brevinema sp.]